MMGGGLVLGDDVDQASEQGADGCFGIREPTSKGYTFMMA